MAHQGVFHVLLSAVSIILLLVAAPVIVYYYRTYRTLQKNVIFAKRYSGIVSLETQLCILKMMLGLMICVSLLLWYDEYQYAQHDQLSVELNGLIAVDFATTLILSYLWIWRFWLLHFDVHFNLSVMGDEWKTVLNTKHRAISSDWYLDHRHTFGNKQWVRDRILIAAFITQCVLALVPRFALSQHSVIWSTMYYNFHLLVPFCTLVAIYCRTNTFVDNFFINKELERIFFFLTTAYAVMFSVNTLPILFLLSNTMKTICFCIQMNAIWLGQCLSILTAIYWVPKQLHTEHYQVKPVLYRKQSTVRSVTVPALKMVATSSETSVATSTRPSVVSPVGPITPTESTYVNLWKNHNFRMPSISSAPSIAGGFDADDNMLFENEYVDVVVLNQKSDRGCLKNKKCIKMYQVLTHAKGFELFMQHLTKEFSVECLLSLVEMVQYQQHIYKYIKHADAQMKGSDANRRMFSECQEFVSSKRPRFAELQFPHVVPLSGIVYGVEESVQSTGDVNERVKMYKLQACELYRKYVDNSASFQINIPFKIKQELDWNMARQADWLARKDVGLLDLLKLFDSSCDQMYTLMLSSYDRFSLTTQFERLGKCIFLD